MQVAEKNHQNLEGRGMISFVDFDSVNKASKNVDLKN